MFKNRFNRLWLVAVLSFAVAPHAAAQTCAAPSSGIVGWWPGNDNGNDIIGKNNGAWVGTAAYAPGEVGRAFSFDGSGSGYLSLDPLSMPHGNSSFTLSAWVLKNTDSNETVLGWGTPGENSRHLHLQFISGMTVSMSAWNNDMWADLPVSAVGRWTHVAFVHWDDSTSAIYLDGAEVEKQGGRTYNLGSTAFVFGQRGDQQYYFDGLLDDVQVYDRALGLSDIQAIYYAGGAGVCRTFCILAGSSLPDVVVGEPVSLQIRTAVGTGQPTFSASGSLPPGLSLGASGLLSGTPTVAGDFSFTIQAADGTGATASQATSMHVGACEPAVGWWPGDDNGSDIAGNNNGAWVGTPAYAPGVVGRAFSFDGSGSGYLSLSPASMPHGNNSFTLSAWVFKNTDSNETVLGWGTPNQYGSHLHMQFINGSTVSMSAWNNDMWAGLPVSAIGRWTHVVFVHWDDSTSAIYLDGAEVQRQKGRTYSIGSTAFKLGQRGDQAYYFNGLLDEVQVYGRALSPREVQKLHDAPGASLCPPAPQPEPLAEAGPDQVLECRSGGATAVLDGSGSTDPAGRALSYSWTEGASLLAQTADPLKTAAAWLGLGRHPIDLVVSNGLLTSSPDRVVITVADTLAPQVATASDDLFLDERPFRELERELERGLHGAEPALPFRLGECVTEVRDACAGPLDVDLVGAITRIEWWPNIEADEAGDARARERVLRSWMRRFEKSGCRNLALAGGARALLPFEELDDPEELGSAYRVYFRAFDRAGNSTSAGCTVRLLGSHRRLARLSRMPASEQPVPLTCAVCVGTDCGACPSPADACKR